MNQIILLVNYSVTTVLQVEIDETKETPTFRVEFGLRVCPLERPPGAESILTIIIIIYRN